MNPSQVTAANENVLDVETLVHRTKAVFNACTNRGDEMTEKEKVEVCEYLNDIQRHADSALDLVIGRVPKELP
jgi:hypothetical protein